MNDRTLNLIRLGILLLIVAASLPPYTKAWLVLGAAKGCQAAARVSGEAGMRLETKAVEMVQP